MISLQLKQQRMAQTVCIDVKYCRASTLPTLTPSLPQLSSSLPHSVDYFDKTAPDERAKL